MADEITKCPLCGREAKVVRSGDPNHVNCERCGEFKIVETLLASLGKEEERALLPYLSAHTRQASERGEVVTLNTKNWKDFALAHKNTPVSRQLTKVLELLAARSSHGVPGRIDRSTDFPLVDAQSTNEFHWLLEQLQERGYVSSLAEGREFILKPKGWERIESSTTAGIPGKCFVAMSFHEDLKDAYDKGIFLAVKEDCKMDPVRMDLVEHNEKICDKMVAESRTCQFLVADVTLQRPNVYFEGGFAMGLGRPVIWTCREDDRKKVQFDTRQYNHIFWKDPKDLRTKLSDRINATIL